MSLNFSQTTQSENFLMAHKICKLFAETGFSHTIAEKLIVLANENVSILNMWLKKTGELSKYAGNY